jgi:hypothetical protein
MQCVIDHGFHPQPHSVHPHAYSVIASICVLISLLDLSSLSTSFSAMQSHLGIYPLLLMCNVNVQAPALQRFLSHFESFALIMSQSCVRP